MTAQDEARYDALTQARAIIQRDGPIDEVVALAVFILDGIEGYTEFRRTMNVDHGPRQQFRPEPMTLQFPPLGSEVNRVPPPPEQAMLRFNGLTSQWDVDSIHDQPDRAPSDSVTDAATQMTWAE